MVHIWFSYGFSIAKRFPMIFTFLFSSYYLFALIFLCRTVFVPSFVLSHTFCSCIRLLAIPHAIIDTIFYVSKICVYEIYTECPLLSTSSWSWFDTTGQYNVWPRYYSEQFRRSKRRRCCGIRSISNTPKTHLTAIKRIILIAFIFRRFSLRIRIVCARGESSLQHAIYRWHANKYDSVCPERKTW